VTVDRPVQRLACLADVHANVAALDAIIASDDFATADAVAFLGCLTPGPEPQAVLQRCAQLAVPTYFLAGNGERAVIELAEGRTHDDWFAGRWILDRHGVEGVAAIRSWPTGLIAHVAQLGDVRLCHGSPRSDIELLTPRTNADRIEAATADVDQRVVVHGHTHLQYERTVAGRRIVGAGSVGLPYTSGEFSAHWVLLGPGIELIQTPYDLSRTRSRIKDSSYPDPRFLDTLEHPPSPEEIIEDAERRCVSD
jgi:diadenosine tetraphosphatase ApaH/serine/threonine PP2A family protein phosphatase